MTTRFLIKITCFYISYGFFGYSFFNIFFMWIVKKKWGFFRWILLTTTMLWPWQSQPGCCRSSGPRQLPKSCRTHPAHSPPGYLETAKFLNFSSFPLAAALIMSTMSVSLQYPNLAYFLTIRIKELDLYFLESFTAESLFRSSSANVLFQSCALLLSACKLEVPPSLKLCT